MLCVSRAVLDVLGDAGCVCSAVLGDAVRTPALIGGARVDAPAGSFIAPGCSELPEAQRGAVHSLYPIVSVGGAQKPGSSLGRELVEPLCVQRGGIQALSPPVGCGGGFY